MKFKKFFVCCLISVSVIYLAGCSAPNKNTAETDLINESRFCIISEDIFEYSYTTAIGLYTAYDKKTKVMYFISSMVGVNGRGSISSTVMLDKDGKPLLWEGELK